MRACSLWVKDTAGYMEDHELDPGIQTKNAFPIAVQNEVPQPVNINADISPLTLRTKG